MIQIDRHIEVLLLDNDCVIVPDLGGFMAYHVPARYVEETGQFIPPSRQLGFNAQLKINDSLLVQSYIEAYDISYPEALRRIEAEVVEMHQIIQNTGMCELNDIGVLRLNDYGSMEFEPCEAGILTPALYGLNTIDIVPVVHKIEVKKKPVVSAVSVERTVAAQPSDEDDIAVTPIVPAPIAVVAKDDEEDAVSTDATSDDEVNGAGVNEADVPRIVIVKRVIAVAAVILALFIIVFPFGTPSQQLSRSPLDSGFLYNLFAQKPSSQTVTPVYVNAKKTAVKPAVDAGVQAKPDGKIAVPTIAEPTKAEPTKAEPTKAEPTKAEPVKSEPVNVKPAKSDQKKAESVKAEPVKAEQDKDEAKSNIPAKSVQGGSYYAIVLASCIPHSNAQSMSRKLSKEGLSDAAVVDRNNGSKVVYGHYASESEARQSLRSLRSQNKSFSKGWVMKFD